MRSPFRNSVPRGYHPPRGASTDERIHPQIHPVFVGEVSGIDVSRPLSREEVAAVEAEMDRKRLQVGMNDVSQNEHATQPRDMRRTTVAGDVPTAAQVPAA